MSSKSKYFKLLTAVVLFTLLSACSEDITPSSNGQQSRVVSAQAGDSVEALVSPTSTVLVPENGVTAVPEPGQRATPVPMQVLPSVPRVLVPEKEEDLSPVVVDEPNPPTSIATGAKHTCALMTQGNVKCWGDNTFGQLGRGSNNTTGSSAPIEVAGITSAIEIAAGGNFTCALLRDETIECWGSNSHGQLGSGMANQKQSSTPAKVVLEGMSARSVSLGDAHACAILKSGLLKCWGKDAAGKVGNVFTPDSVQGVDSDAQFKSVSLGSEHTCGLIEKTDRVQCWGNNSHQQLGSGKSGFQSPAFVHKDSERIELIAAGGRHSCSWYVGGGLRCWGDNGKGQIGDGVTDGKTVKMHGFSNHEVFNDHIISLSLGSNHSCALLSKGDVRCWGSNDRGQIGSNSGPFKIFTPTPVLDLSNVIKISAGGLHTCAILTDGKLKCWGDNIKGQLGDGTFLIRIQPVLVNNL